MPDINPIPHPIMVDLQKRVGRLEDHSDDHRKVAAEHNLAFALLSKDVQVIKGDVSTINRGISKILWTVICSAITAGVGIAVTFVITGGLSLN